MIYQIDKGIMVPKILPPVFICLLAFLTGCATSSNIQKEYRLTPGERLKLQLIAPTATDVGKQILRERLETQLSNNGLLAQTSDSAARILEVNVTNYMFRPGAARVMLGFLAGTDNVQSTVKVKDAVTGNTLSEYTVESKNASAWGSAGGLLENHADEIVATLKGIKK